LLLFLAPAGLLVQAPAQDHSPITTASSSLLVRRYTDGEKLTYRMKGSNEAWHYEVQADGVVKTDADGRYFEEYAWSNLTSDHSIALTPASLNFRQDVSLTSGYKLSIPGLSKVQPALIGPSTDWLTFSADLQLAMSQHFLHAGEHAYVKNGHVNSWARMGATR
jgi:hypothetical protein